MSEFSVVDVAEGDRLISQKEAAARLGTNQAFIKKLIDTSLLPCIQFGRHKRISICVLSEFIRKHQGNDLHTIVMAKEKEQAS
mgnify:CR=1 FL=1